MGCYQKYKLTILRLQSNKKRQLVIHKRVIYTAP